ncbi:MAG: hypothetical protein ABI480_09445 [Chitinophagaceae bacterium]
MKNTNHPVNKVTSTLLIEILFVWILLGIATHAISQDRTTDFQNPRIESNPIYEVNSQSHILVNQSIIASSSETSDIKEHIPDITPDKLFAVAFTGQPANSSICETNNTSFSVTATGTGTLTYQWQVSTDGGSTFANVISSPVYTGVSTATLQITGAVFSMNNYRYKCIVTDNSGSTPSTAGILTVNPAPVAQTGNAAVAICANGGGTISAQFFSGQTYQWQVSSNNGISWNNITDGGSYSGTATDILVISSPASLNGFLYRYITSYATGCPTISGVDTLHVLQPVISTQPIATTICVGSTAVFTAAASSPTTLTYQWQLGTSNISNNAVYSGTTTPALTIANTTAAMDRQLYRVVVKDTLPCSVNSSQVRLFVITPPSIITQPQNASICAGLNTSFTVSATAASLSGIAALAYQWQTDNGSNNASWSDITSGGTSAMLSLSAVTISMNGYHYRVNINTGACGSITSSIVTLSVRSSGTWLGAVDTNWHVAGNWCGGVPVSSTDVLIPNWAPRMPTISNATGVAYSRSLTIENNAKLTIFGGSTSMSGPFDIQGTVAYTANANQPVLPADHGSLEINGNGNKSLQISTGIIHNLVLGGAAKLVTGTNILTMKNGSNPISGAVFSSAANSWIVTGNGASGAANTGLGALRYEQLDATDGNIIFPVGPTSASFNPARLQNNGIADNYSMAVSDQPIPGVIADLSINRHWLLSETIAGGSNLFLQLQWNNNEEQSAFFRGQSEIIRSNGAYIVERSATGVAPGTDPYTRGEGSFVSPSRFSVATYAAATVLPVKLLSFTVHKLNDASASLVWQTDDQPTEVLYIIERSEDGQHFNVIGKVQSESATTLYNFIDSKTAGNISWYRLHMISGGKENSYSRTIQLINYDNHARITLRPSVTDKEVTNLSLSLPQQEDIVIRILDITGRLYSRQSVQLSKGEHSLPLNIGSLMHGIYYVQVAGTHNIRQVLTLIKQ